MNTIIGAEGLEEIDEYQAIQEDNDTDENTASIRSRLQITKPNARLGFSKLVKKDRELLRLYDNTAKPSDEMTDWKVQYEHLKGHVDNLDEIANELASEKAMRVQLEKEVAAYRGKYGPLPADLIEASGPSRSTINKNRMLTMDGRSTAPGQSAIKGPLTLTRSRAELNTPTGSVLNVGTRRKDSFTLRQSQSPVSLRQSMSLAKQPSQQNLSRRPSLVPAPGSKIRAGAVEDSTRAGAPPTLLRMMSNNAPPKGAAIARITRRLQGLPSGDDVTRINPRSQASVNNLNGSGVISKNRAQSPSTLRNGGPNSILRRSTGRVPSTLNAGQVSSNKNVVILERRPTKEFDIKRMDSARRTEIDLLPQKEIPMSAMVGPLRSDPSLAWPALSTLQKKNSNKPGSQPEESEEKGKEKAKIEENDNATARTILKRSSQNQERLSELLIEPNSSPSVKRNNTVRDAISKEEIEPINRKDETSS